MSTPFPLAGRLVGGCDLHIDGRFAARCRCWLDTEREEFAIEDSAQLGIKAGEDRITFHNLVFSTQTGEVRAQQLPVSFARFRPLLGGWDARDSFIARTFDFVNPAPVWRFVCNEAITFSATSTVEEVFLRPGKRLVHHVDLVCGSRLIGGEHGLCIRNSPDFNDANLAALEIALGCPLRECARQSGQRLTLFLTNWHESGEFRPLFNEAINGVLNHEKRAEGISEVYRAVLCYQQAQPDNGRAFRLAVESFMESRSRPLGYTIRMLAVMQLLEWLDGSGTMKAHVLAEKFHLKGSVANALMILRNEVSHNHHNPFKKTDLLTSVMKASDVYERAGIDLLDLGTGNREAGLLNFHFSLAGRLLLELVGANVEPARFVPGHGRFPY